MNELSNLNYCQEAITLKRVTEQNFLMLGQYLFKIRESELFLGQWTSFPEFLDEMNMLEGTASKLINIYKRFVMEFNFKERLLLDAGGWTKLAAILPVVKDKSDAHEWLLKASTLSIRDLNMEIKENKTGIDMSKCGHKDTYLVRICRDCGYRHEELAK